MILTVREMNATIIAIDAAKHKTKKLEALKKMLKRNMNLLIENKINQIELSDNDPVAIFIKEVSIGFEEFKLQFSR